MAGAATAKRGSHTHPDHSMELGRLNRVIGQLEGVKKMIEGRRYCPDILVQTRAITSAVMAVESNILGRHIESCVRNAFDSTDSAEANSKVAELVDVFKGFRRT